MIVRARIHRSLCKLLSAFMRSDLCALYGGDVWNVALYTKNKCF